MGLGLSIVIPAYNEGKRTAAFLEKLIEYSNTHFDNFEIIVVDDGSTDKTLDFIRDVSRDNETVKIISYPENKGKGFAVKQGVLASLGEKIIFVDGDGAFSAKDLPKFIKALDDYDLVLGKKKHSKLSRIILSKIFIKIVRLLFPFDLDDVLCGFKGFNNHVGKKLFGNLKSNGPVFDIEVLIKAKDKYKIIVVPVNMSAGADRNLSFKYMLLMFFQLLKLKAMYIFRYL